MKTAVRKLQELLQFFGKTVSPISLREEKNIRAALINCDKWLPQEQLQTFHKLIKAAYQLEKVSFSGGSLERLHGSVMRQLQKRDDEGGREKKAKRTIKVQDDVKVNNSNGIDLIDLSGNNHQSPSRYA